MSNYDDFLLCAEPNLTRACGARLSCLAIARAPTWIALCTTIVLGPPESLAAIEAPEDLRIDDLMMFVRLIPPSAVSALLELVKGGLLNQHFIRVDSPVSLTPITGPAVLNFSSPLRYEAARRQFSPYGVEFGGYECVATTDHVSQALDWRTSEAVRLQLPSSPAMARDFDELARRYAIGAEFPTHRRTSLVSPLWIAIEAVVAEPSTAKLEIVLASHWPDAIAHAGLVVIPTDRIRSAPSRNPTIEPMPFVPAIPPVYRGVARVHWSPDDRSVNIVASLMGRMIDERVGGLPNTRVRAHHFFDDNLVRLRRQLKPKTLSQHSEFEAGICTLLHLCGFAVEHVGGGTANKEVDLIAFVGNSVALFGECTNETPSKEKCMALQTRASECLRSLEITQHRVPFIVFTPSTLHTRDSMPLDPYSHVTIVDASTINDLLVMASRGDSVERTLARIKARPKPG